MKYKDYEAYQKAEQDAFNKLPIFWAFSNEQLHEGMKERGLKENEYDKLYKFGHGGFYLKTDAPKIHEWLNRKDELKEHMQDAKWAEDAIYYEMANHEYPINWQGDYDVCACFGAIEYHGDEPNELDLYFEELGFTDATKQAYLRARKRLFKYWNDNEMF